MRRELLSPENLLRFAKDYCSNTSRINHEGIGTVIPKGLSLTHDSGCYCIYENGEQIARLEHSSFPETLGIFVILQTSDFVYANEVKEDFKAMMKSKLEYANLQKERMNRRLRESLRENNNC